MKLLFVLVGFSVGLEIDRNTVTAYKIDKILWLLCTDEFYLDDRRMGREAIYRKIDSLMGV